MFSNASLRAFLALALCSVSSLSVAALKIDTIAEDLDKPWSLAELPDGGFLVTERPGSIKHVATSGEITAVAGVPEVFTKRQGGLFDVVLHPNFAVNNTIFLAYAAGSEDSNRTTVARGVLDGNTLTNVTVIFEVSPTKRGGGHFGGRMAFLADGTMLLSGGEG